MDDMEDVLIYEDADSELYENGLQESDSTLFDVNKRISSFQKQPFCKNVVVEAEKVRDIRITGVDLMLELRQNSGSALNLCRYWCALCDKSMMSSSVVPHLTSAAHKFLYVKSVFPSLYNFIISKEKAKRDEELNSYNKIIGLTIGSTTMATATFNVEADIKNLLRKKVKLLANLSYYDSVNVGANKSGAGMRQSSIIGQKLPLIRQNSPKLGQKSSLIRQTSPQLGQKSPLIRQNSSQIGQRSPLIRQNSPLITDKVPLLRRKITATGPNPPVVTLDDDDVKVLDSSKRVNSNGTQNEVPFKRKRIEFGSMSENTKSKPVVVAEKTSMKAIEQKTTINESVANASATSLGKAWMSARVLIVTSGGANGHKYDEDMFSLPSVTYAECPRTDMNLVLMDKFLKNKKISLDDFDIFLFFPFDWIFSRDNFGLSGMMHSNNIAGAKETEERLNIRDKVCNVIGSLKSSYGVLSKKYPRLKMIGVLPHPLNYANMNLKAVGTEGITNIKQFKTCVSINQYSMVMGIVRMWLMQMPDFPFIPLMDLVVAKQQYTTFVNGKMQLQWAQGIDSDCVGTHYSKKFKSKIWNQIRCIFISDGKSYKKIVDTYAEYLSERNVPEGKITSSPVFESACEEFIKKRSEILEQIGISSSLYNFTEEFAYHWNTKTISATASKGPDHSKGTPSEPKSKITLQPTVTRPKHVLGPKLVPPPPSSGRSSFLNSNGNIDKMSGQQSTKSISVDSSLLGSFTGSLMGSYGTPKGLQSSDLRNEITNQSGRSILGSYVTFKGSQSDLRSEITNQSGLRNKVSAQIPVQNGTQLKSILKKSIAPSPEKRNIISLNKRTNVSDEQAAQSRLNKFIIHQENVAIPEVVSQKNTVISIKRKSDFTTNAENIPNKRKLNVPSVLSTKEVIPVSPKQKTVSSMKLSSSDNLLNKRTFENPSKISLNSPKIIEIEPPSKKSSVISVNKGISNSENRLNKTAFNSTTNNQTPSKGNAVIFNQRSADSLTQKASTIPPKQGDSNRPIINSKQPAFSDYSPLATLNMLFEAKKHLGFLKNDLERLKNDVTKYVHQNKDPMRIFVIQVDSVSLVELCLTRLKKALLSGMPGLEKLGVEVVVKECEIMVVEIKKVVQEEAIKAEAIKAEAIKAEAKKEEAKKAEAKKVGERSGPYKNYNNYNSNRNVTQPARATGAYGQNYQRRSNAQPVVDDNMSPLMRSILSKGSFEMKNFYENRTTRITEPPPSGSLRESILLSVGRPSEAAPKKSSSSPFVGQVYNSDFTSRPAPYNRAPEKSTWRVGKL